MFQASNILDVKNCVGPANLDAEIQLELSNKRVLGTGEPCTCKHVTLLQLFHR